MLVFTDDVFDLNGGQFESFAWELIAGPETTPLGTSQIQNLSADHIARLINTQTTLAVHGTFRDALGFETVYSAHRAANSFGIGDLPTQGAVVVDGSPYFTAGALYTANISGLSDLKRLRDFYLSMGKKSHGRAKLASPTGRKPWPPMPW